MIDVSPYVQILDALVPQAEDHALEFFRLDLPVAEQVIDVPKISSSSCPSRAVLNEPQVVEQLVEVPTLLSVAVLQQRTAEQIVDTPVPRGRGQGFSQLLANAFLSGLWSRSSTFLLLVVAWDTGLPHLLVLQMRNLLGVFALFPMEKSAECRAGGECAAG